MTQQSVYLSYVARDESHAGLLRDLLERNLALVVFTSQQAGSTPDIQEWIAARIAAANALVVLVGEASYQSSFVQLEAQRARELQKPVVVVKLAPGYITPSALYELPAIWTDLPKCEGVLAGLLRGRAAEGVP
jgi:hypothetical protein